MEIFSAISLSLLLLLSLSTWVNSRKALAAPTKPATPASLPDGPSSPSHMLKRTWIGEADLVVAGWRWQCTCGVIGAAGDAKASTNSLGSEGNAIENFKIHARGYKEANGNAWKDRHDALQVKFDAFVEKCYCKETTHHQLERL